ncbi:hypothetical protein ID866_8938, partial [Astraeus odoratus]
MRSLSFFGSSLALIAAFNLLPFVVAQNHTNEESEAQITDPNLECTPYSYSPVTQALSQFPPLWTVASILPNDAAARNKYNSIQGQIPNISPKGTQPQSLTGDFGGFSYPSNDPDCWWTATHCTSPKATGIPADVAYVPEVPGTIGYGFDDGPNCGHNGFYDFLQSKNQTATMFYIGSNVMYVPLEAQRALADGHEICIPGLTDTLQVIKLVVGVTPTCWRVCIVKLLHDPPAKVRITQPPYGDVDDRIRAIAHALGLRNILWQYDSSDWQGNPNNTDANYQNFINIANGGAFSNVGTIFLAHELSNFTMSEAIKWYDGLTSAFKYLVPVGVALNITQPYVENGYTLPTFAQYVNGTHVGSIIGVGNSNGTGSSSGTMSGPTSTSSLAATASSSIQPN